MAGTVDRRLKVLRAMRRLPHRYDHLRTVGMSVSLAILVAVPLSGLARVDLWGGRHALKGGFHSGPQRITNDSRATP